MAATYLIDSDVCIHVVRKRAASLMEMVRDIRPDGLAISVITAGEVLDGILGSHRRDLDAAQWRWFTAGIDVLNIDRFIAERWAELRYGLRQRGQLIGDNDLIIAATALHLGLRLVTRNARHLARVPGLDLLIPPI